MPLLVKDYTWTENSNEVIIDIPLKGTKKKVDIFSTDIYLKASFPPYFFECLTAHPFDESKCRSVVGDGLLTFYLPKLSPETWGELESPDMKDKEKMRQRREEAVTKFQEREAERSKAKAEAKRLNEKFALNEMMRLDQEEHSRIAAAKEAVREEAVREMAELQEKIRKEDEARRRTAKQEAERLEWERRKAARNEIFENTQQQQQQKALESLDDIVAPLRKPERISVKFTERVFPTPVRESTSAAEQEWLQKQKERRQMLEAGDQDLSEGERDPVWLRNKGNDFFAAGNYEAAVNAYSHAISLDSQLHSLFSNRAACHLKLRNFYKALDDTSRAIDLLNPPVEANRRARVRAHVRRGTAFCQLEMFAEGLLDFEKALKLDPDNEALRKDAEEVRRMVQREA